MHVYNYYYWHSPWHSCAKMDQSGPETKISHYTDSGASWVAHNCASLYQVEGTGDTKIHTAMNQSFYLLGSSFGVDRFAAFVDHALCATLVTCLV
jgi:hypothetical protein